MVDSGKDRFAPQNPGRFESPNRPAGNTGHILNEARKGVAMRVAGALCIALAASNGFWLDMPHTCKDSKGVYDIDGHFSPNLERDDRGYFDPDALTAKISDPDCIFGEQDLSRHCNAARLECARQEDKASALATGFGPAILTIIGALLVRAGRKNEDDEEDDEDDQEDEIDLSEYEGAEVTILDNEGTRDLGIAGKIAVVTEIDGENEQITIYCLGMDPKDSGPFELDLEDVRLNEISDEDAE